MEILFFFLLATVLIIIGFIYIALPLVKRYIKPVDRWNLPVNVPAHFKSQDQLIHYLGQKASLSNTDYESIFKYFLLGIEAYASPGRARIVYPGVSGTRGSVVEGLEGFARTSVLLSSWLSAERPEIIKLEDGKKFNVLKHLISGIAEGTSKSSEEYWGDINDLDQRIVESADIAISIWLIKSQIEKNLKNSEIQQILHWLNQINGKKSYGGNWLLFRIIVNSVLTDFGYQNLANSISNDYAEFKSFYLGTGWFSDGKEGAIDYYNAWQMQYMLYWLAHISPGYDQEFLSTVFREFSEFYQYFIGPEGIPIFGRSCSYRLAAATPLVVASAFSSNQWSGKARRAMDLTWGYFIKHGSVAEGRVTQGYYTDDENLLENYSGRASPLWSLRSLVIAFHLEDSHNFWTEPTENLPIEDSSYKKSIPEIGLHIEGNYDTKEIIVCCEKNIPNESSAILNLKFSRMSFFRRHAQSILKRPLRIENYGAKYKRQKYSSKKLFFYE
jgi:hypothetical protein